MTEQQNDRVMITISTKDKKLKAEVQKHLKIISAITEMNHDSVLLEALRKYRKEIEEKLQ